MTFLASIFFVGCNNGISGNNGCFPFCDDSNSDNNVKSISVSGVDTYREISSSTPVRLVISGVENEIIVSKGTNVESISLSGTDNIIKLPSGVSPAIEDSGIDNTILYY
jgi:hypothetical protein